MDIFDTPSALTSKSNGVAISFFLQFSKIFFWFFSFIFYSYFLIKFSVHFYTFSMFCLFSTIFYFYAGFSIYFRPSKFFFSNLTFKRFFGSFSPWIIFRTYPELFSWQVWFFFCIEIDLFDSLILFCRNFRRSTLFAIFGHFLVILSICLSWRLNILIDNSAVVKVIIREFSFRNTPQTK